jgi:uncharacterized protein (DUF4415 family)
MDSRRRAAEFARSYADAMTDEADARLTAAALADPDNPPLNEDAPAIGKRIGRPPSPAPKALVTVRIDPDVLARLKADGAGWQTRLNDILRKSLIG